MKLLWLKTELLHPVDKGGRIRTYQMLRQIKRRHEVVYLTLDDGTAGDGEVAAASEYCDELIRIPHRRSTKFSAAFFRELAANAVSTLPYFVHRYASQEMEDAITRLDRRGDIDLIVCDFLVPAVNFPKAVESPAILFQHNVEAEIWRRHAQVAPGPVRRAYFRSQWRRTVRFEKTASGRFDHVVAVSGKDRDTFVRDYGLSAVSVVETGVDVDYFKPSGRPSTPKRLVFTGSMDWLPNVDGMEWFCGSVLPRVQERHPDATLAIVGRTPNQAVRALGEGRQDVVVSGTVQDVRPWIEEGAVYVVPLRIGGGTRLKIYEAMALERPVVSTAVGMEGLPLEVGREISVADDPAGFAARVCDLLDDPDAGRAMARRAAERVRGEFGWESVSERFVEICESARSTVGQGV